MPLKALLLNGSSALRRSDHPQQASTGLSHCQLRLATNEWPITPRDYDGGRGSLFRAIALGFPIFSLKSGDFTADKRRDIHV